MKHSCKIVLTVTFIMLLGQLVFSQDTIGLVGKLTYTGIPVHDVLRYVDESTGIPYALLCASNAGMRIIDISDPEIRCKPEPSAVAGWSRLM